MRLPFWGAFFSIAIIKDLANNLFESQFFVKRITFTNNTSVIPNAVNTD